MKMVVRGSTKDDWYWVKDCIIVMIMVQIFGWDSVVNYWVCLIVVICWGFGFWFCVSGFLLLRQGSFCVSVFL